MKTIGLSRIYAKHCAAFIFAILIITTVSAQVSYSSFKNFSSIDQKKDLAANFSGYKSETNAVTSRYFVRSVAENSMLNNDPGKAVIIENSEVRLKPTSFSYPENSRFDVGINEYATELLLFYARALKQYAKKNGYDTTYAFLSNMGMLSNKKRFFVINLSTMKIEEAGLVSHGRGQGKSIYAKQYSNKTGSRSTSLGRYKILGKYSGSYGAAYRMAGLDHSNQNAFSRNIVLHSMGCIPDAENRMPACVSDGCPAVSTKFLSFLQQIIDSRKKPVLLWIFDSNVEEMAFDGDDIHTRHVSNSEVYAAVLFDKIREPQLFNDSFKKPFIDNYGYYNTCKSSSAKRNLFGRIKSLFNQ